MPLRLGAIALLIALLGAGCTGEPAPAPSAPPATTGSASPSPTRTAAPSASPSVKPAATGIPAALKGQDLTRIPTTAKVVALTFDAGANADGVASILATLQREGIKGTFFLTGGFVNDFPAQSQGIVAAGHRIGNHTMTHPHLTQLLDVDTTAQILDAQGRIQAVTGADPRPFFRFPYGDRNAHAIQLVNFQGYIAVRWTVDSLGWQGTTSHTAASVAQRVVDAAQPGAIALMHVGSHPDDHSTLDADALPAIIAGYRARGYSFVTLDVLV